MICSHSGTYVSAGVIDQWDITKGHKRSDLIIFDPLSLDRITRFRQRLEPMEVQTLVAKRAVEWLNDGVIRSLTGMYVSIRTLW